VAVQAAEAGALLAGAGDAAQQSPELRGLGLVQTLEEAGFGLVAGARRPAQRPAAGAGERLGFRPTVPTIYAAARDGIL
jgi:hypothetical protein